MATEDSHPRQPAPAGTLPGWSGRIPIDYHAGMCGRFNLRTPASELAAFFEIVFDSPLAETLVPRFNIAPSQPVLVIGSHAENPSRTPMLVQWGLVPGWAKDPSLGTRMINARGETVAEKPSFRAAFRHRRCLVPATGFYEWQRTDGPRKQPWHIHRRDEAPFAFAGIWEHWEAADGSVLQSCAIITTSPNPLLTGIHDRMPVVLSPSNYDRWINPLHQDCESLEALMVPCPTTELVADPVSDYVNRPGNDGQRCVDPVQSLEDAG